MSFQALVKVLRLVEMTIDQSIMTCTILEGSKNWRTVLPRFLATLFHASFREFSYPVNEDICVAWPNNAPQERKICLVNRKVIFPEIQGKFIAEQRVIAGHFQWGEPYSTYDHSFGVREDTFALDAFALLNSPETDRLHAKPTRVDDLGAPSPSSHINHMNQINEVYHANELSGEGTLF